VTHNDRYAHDCTDVAAVTRWRRPWIDTTRLQINGVKTTHFHPATCNFAYWLTRYGSPTIYRCFTLPQLLYRWRHQSGIFGIPPRIATSCSYEQVLFFVQLGPTVVHYTTFQLANVSVLIEYKNKLQVRSIAKEVVDRIANTVKVADRVPVLWNSVAHGSVRLTIRSLALQHEKLPRKW
jgi:hypothetical protein